MAKRAVNLPPGFELEQPKWAEAPIIESAPPKWAEAPIIESAPLKRDDGIDFEPIDDGTWPGEIGHALSRTGRQMAAAGPGAVAGALSLGERLQRLEWQALNRLTGADKPFPEAPVEKIEQHVKRPLRRKAQELYRSAEAPELAPRKSGVGGFLVNTVIPAAGYMGASAATAAVAGPAGPLVFGTVTGGEMMYQEAMKDMEDRTDLAPEEKEARAEVERLVFGPIYGAIERLQAGGILKAGKPAIRAAIQAARAGALREAVRLGAGAAKSRLLDAAWEGVEESLQEATQIGAATIHGKMPNREDIRRIGQVFVGGAVAGGILKGAVDVAGARRQTAPMPTRTPSVEARPTTEAVAAETAEAVAGDLNIREPEMEGLPLVPGEPLGAKSEWQMRREFAPIAEPEPLPQTYRSTLVNRHIALYQAFDAAESGSSRQKQLSEKIYATIRAINDADGIADPAEGRQFVPPEYEALRAQRPSVLEELVKAEKETVERIAAFDEAQAKAQTTREQQETAEAWHARRTEPPVAGPGEAVTPAKRRIRKAVGAPVSNERPATAADGGVVLAVVGAKPRTRRGLEVKIHKLAKQAGLSVDQYHDALETAVGKRSVKGLSGDELRIAADNFQRTYGKAPAQTPVVVAGQMTTMEAVIDEATQTATSLKPQKRVLRKRVRIGSAGGLHSVLRATGRFFFGDRSASPYFIAKVLDGGNESGVFGRVLDRNIQDGNSIRASLVAAITRMSRRARDAAGITPDDLARMSRAANPRPKTVERVLPKTEIIPVEIAGRTWDVTWGRLLDFYGQTSQVISETGEPIGREYAKSYGIEIDKQITGPMTDAEIDYLRSLVEQNPKAKAELDIEWGVVGPFRAQAINAISSQTEGRAIAVVPNWWHIELGRGRRVPGKTIETAEPRGESETVEAALKAEEARGFKIDLLENQDILKARRGGGRGPLVIRDWWERGNALNHAVAEYNGLALPFRTARTLLNHPDVQRELDAKGYEEPRKLLTELFSRIQGSERGTVGQMPGMFKKLRANFYRAVINWSPHVWLGQPTSVLNYGAYADAKYLPAASAHMFDPHGLQEILDNSPIAYERFHGGFSTMGLAESMESGAVVQALTGKSAWIDKPSIGMRVTDMMPLRGGWALAKAEFRDAKAGRMNPDGLSARWWGDKSIAEFEEGDQAWMNVIRERAEYLWQRSQQTWDPVNRSEITSNPNEAVRTLFMFRSYHDKVLTIWRDALLDLQTGRSTKAEFAGRVSYPMASYMAEAAARAILLTAIFGDVKEADDYITAIVTSPLQAFPIFGTAMQAAIMSFVRAARGRKQQQKYDLLSSPILDMVNKTAEAIPLTGQAVGEWAEGDTEKAQKTAERAMYRILEPLAIGLLGIPIYHARRLRKGYLAPEQEQEHRGRVVRRRVLRQRRRADE